MAKYLAITLTLIALNFAVFIYEYFICQNGAEFGMKFGLNWLFFTAKFYFQPLTTMFLHGSLTHILMNMAVLFGFGRILEPFLGRWHFLLVYMLGGAITSCLGLGVVYYYMSVHEVINIVGASGAICVLFGVLAVFDKENSKGLFMAVLLMSFLPLLLGENVAWHIHLIGFAVGFIYGLIYKKIRFKNAISR